MNIYLATILRFTRVLIHNHIQTVNPVSQVSETVRGQKTEHAIAEASRDNGLMIGGGWLHF